MLMLMLMLMLLLLLLLINPMLFLLTLPVCYRSGYRSGSIRSHPIVVGFAVALSLRRFAAAVVVVAALLLLLIDPLLLLLLLLISGTVAAVINQTELEL